MKTFYTVYAMIVITFLFLFFTQANETPKYMKDGTITVTLKDGSVSKFSTNEYMVVKRVVKKVVVEETKSNPVTKVVVKEPKSSFIISGLIGATRSGIKDSFDGSSLKVEQAYEMDAGALFQKRVNDSILLNVLGTIRGNVMVGIGQEF